MKSFPSLRVISLSVFIALSLVPYGWNKFDNPTHAGLLYLLGGLLLFLGALSWKRIIHTQGLLKSWFSSETILNGTVILLPILSYVAFVVSPIQNLGWSEVMVMAAGIGIFVIARTFTEKERDDLVRILVLIGTLAALVGLGQYLVRDESRIAGPFYEAAFKPHYWPNAFALFLLLVWPLAAGMKGEGRTWRIAKVISSSLLLSALFLTFSRAAVLAAIVQTFFLAWIHRGNLVAFFHPQRKAAKRLLAPAITILLVVVLVLGMHQARATIHPAATNSFATKASFAGTEKQTSFTERAQFMSGAARLALEKPWFGHGLFSFRFVYPRLQMDLLAVSDHPHNWYLKLAMEQGIPVATLFVILLLAVFWSRKNLLWDKPTSSAFLLIAVLGVLAHNVADYNMNFLTNQVAFWGVLGLLSASGVSVGKNAKRRWWGTITFIGILLVAGSLLLEGYFSTTRQYDRMAFPRSLFLNQARGEAAQGKVQEAIGTAKHHLELNPYDAYGWDFLGRTLESSNPRSALDSYRQAIEADPANDFGFYVRYVQLARTLGTADIPGYADIVSGARALLASYPALAEENVHYTAQSGNARSAVELAKLLGQADLARRIEAARKKWTRE